MSRQLRKLNNLMLMGIATTVLSSIMVADACANGCQPATPCPCAADGTCRPQGPWGHSQTRWRPWPGDVVGTKPTTAQEEEQQEQLRLEPYETPLPENEGLRGAKVPESRKKKSSRDSGEAPVGDPLGGLEQGLGDDFPVAEPVVQPQQPIVQPQPVEQPAEPLEQPAEINGFELPGGVDVDEPMQDAPLPEADPDDDFDPFSDIQYKPAVPRTARQPATTAPQPQGSGPPALPASLQKLSRTMGPTHPSQRSTRYRANGAVALAH